MANCITGGKKRYDDCWLGFSPFVDSTVLENYKKWCSNIVFDEEGETARTACDELVRSLQDMLSIKPAVSCKPSGEHFIVLELINEDSPYIKVDKEEIKQVSFEGFMIKTVNTGREKYIYIAARSGRGLIYGVFKFLYKLVFRSDIENLHIIENPVNPLRMINHWDNMDGSIERGYAGRSLFYEGYELTEDLDRVRYYARLLASVGINGVVINNVNVHYQETRLVADKIHVVKTLADIFRKYGIQTYLSINYASPIQLTGLDTADPLDERVAGWWKQTVDKIYEVIPDFGGFLVKADSENRPGPYTYNRNHAEGANMIARALKPHGGILIWRCFVYNCQQDWRDLSIDRAKAAYENYQYLDGQFMDNVILQIKNGPMDFQVREPVSPLFGAMKYTNQMIELQITQEYTGQQRHLCYLIPMWKEVLDFDTYAKGKGSTVKRVVDGSLFDYKYSGFAGVVNVGRDYNWTGHYLAQANLYGYARLAWNPELSAEKITEEWIKLTYGSDPDVLGTISDMLLKSWRIYENYNAPLGIGWMVNPSYHYGPNPDGYEYSRWGTYHKADHEKIGVDRTVKNGTGFTAQYFKENMEMYESPDTCPDELILFFHRLPYTYRLKSGKTIIQHIYDTHFEGVEQAKELREQWLSLKGKVDGLRFEHVLKRLEEQIEHAREWRDVINSYFYRKTGIPDEKGRKIY